MDNHARIKPLKTMSKNKRSKLIEKWDKKQEEEPRLVLNRIKTPDGTILTSYHRHDYVTHVDANGKTYMVDGGLEYARRNLHKDHPYEELSVYTDTPFEQIREVFQWGTYGKNQDQPLKWIPLSTMTNEHIEAIFDNGDGGSKARELMELEISYRKHTKIVLRD